MGSIDLKIKNFLNQKNLNKQIFLFYVLKKTSQKI